MTTKTIVIYHAPCSDGTAAAACFYAVFGDAVTYVRGAYGGALPDVDGADVYMVDFSYDRATVEAMLRSASRVTLIDHHATALKALADVPGLHYHCSQDKSGAGLAWEFLNPGVTPALYVRLVQDRDLWRFELPESKAFHAGLGAYEGQPLAWYAALLNDDDMVRAVAAEGVVLLRAHTQQVERTARIGRRTLTIAGHTVPACGAIVDLASDLGALLGVGAPFAAIYTDTAKHRQFSLRSAQDGLDVALIAQGFGGGGHPHAAGFAVPRDHPLAQA